MFVNNLHEMEDLGIVNKTFSGERDSHTYETLPVSTDAIHEDTANTPNQIKCGRLWNTKTCIIMVLFMAICIIAIAATLGTLLGMKLSLKDGADQAACDISPLTRNGILVNVSNVKPGDVAELGCLSIKDKLVGHSRITCLSSGEWSSVSSCEIKRCATLSSLPNAKVSYGFNSSDVGDTMELICNEGFDMIGNGTMVCLPNETWSMMPRCEPKDCGFPPNVPNGVVLRTENTKFNSTLQIRCKEGYELSNEQDVVCNKNGEWSETPSCRPITCGFPVVPVHVSITHINGTNYQDVVEVACEEGFTLQGDNMMTCSKQRIWTPIPNCSIKDCGTPPYLNHAEINNLTTTHFNSTFVIQCIEGFTASSNNLVVCDSNGLWTNIPTCNPVFCGTLVPPENGHIIFINGTAFGDVAIIDCNDDYTLNGSQFVTCLSSSKWSYFPSCLRVDCGTPPSSRNGAIKDLTTTHFNSKFVIQCNEGFTASSNNSVVCDSNGQWTTIPTCNPVVCGTLVPPENGYIIFINGTAFGDVATINCNDDYTLNGSQFVTCLSSSKWSDMSSCIWTAKVSDCYDIQQMGLGSSDGVYNVTLWQSKRTIQVFCDLTTDGGGWTVFQNRYDGSVDFYRNFFNYTSGFGDLNGEFWLGLDILHEMTTQRLTELRIDVTADSGTTEFELFKNFSISAGPEYVLNNLPGSGTIEQITGPKLTYHTGQSFSTYDHDRDKGGNCAKDAHGAWWYNSCYHYNLNGRYLYSGLASMTYYNYTGGYFASLKSSRMMFRVQH